MRRSLFGSLCIFASIFRMSKPSVRISQTLSRFATICHRLNSHPTIATHQLLDKLNVDPGRWGPFAGQFSAPLLHILNLSHRSKTRDRHIVSSTDTCATISADLLTEYFPTILRLFVALCSLLGDRNERYVYKKEFGGRKELRSQLHT